MFAATLVLWGPSSSLLKATAKDKSILMYMITVWANRRDISKGLQPT